MPVVRLFARVSSSLSVPQVRHAFPQSVKDGLRGFPIANHNKYLLQNHRRSLSGDAIQQQQTLQGAHEASGSSAYKPSEKPEFPGSRSQFIGQLEFCDPEQYEGIPVYRVMNRDGNVLCADQDPNLSREMTTKMYKGYEKCIFLYYIYIY